MSLKRRMRAASWVLVALAAAGWVAEAAAAVSVGDTVRFFRREGGANGGGEFGVAVLPQASTELFRTFCLQKDQLLDFSPDGFVVDGISDRVQPQNDQIDARTAYLYTQFSQGTLSNYHYTNPGHHNAANELQEAIWFLEGELGSADGQALTWINEAAQAITDNLWSGLGRVAVLNLSWATSRHGIEAGAGAQDVLTMVPEPSSLAVWTVLGLSCAGAFWRRRKVAAG